MVFRLALFLLMVITGFVALYFFTRKKWDWNSYAGSLAAVFTILLIVPIAMFIWVNYENRLQTLDSFSGVELGAKTAEVKFIKGKPDHEISMGEEARLWRYLDDTNPNNQLDIRFENGNVKELSFSGPCEYCETINNFGIGTPYEEVIKRFGEAENIEISDNELEHRLNYPDYQVFFVFKKGHVIRHGIYTPGEGENP